MQDVVNQLVDATEDYSDLERDFGLTLKIKTKVLMALKLT